MVPLLDLPNDNTRDATNESQGKSADIVSENKNKGINNISHSHVSACLIGF